MYAQGHADLHVLLILIQLRMTQPTGTQLTAVMQVLEQAAMLIRSPQHRSYFIEEVIGIKKTNKTKI